MSRRNVQLVILCEDPQQETFVRRFLKKVGWSMRRVRVERGTSPEKGSKEQFVRERFPREIQAYRSKISQVDQRLVVMTDGDQWGVKARKDQLDAACQKQGVPPRQPTDRVAVLVPTWNIETWLAYLRGVDVDESKSDYPRLRGQERRCQPQVHALAAMCQKGQLRQPVPPSLKDACDEYQRLV